MQLSQHPLQAPRPGLPLTPDYSIVKPVIQEHTPKQPSLHHLRKVIHLPHLPRDLLERRMVITRPGQPSAFLIQVAQQKLADAMLAALKSHMESEPNIVAIGYDHLPRCFPVSVPLHAPLDEQQSKLWSERYWPSIYNPAAQVLQDAPPLHQLRKVMVEQDTDFTDQYLGLAGAVAEEVQVSGHGKPVGAVVVDPMSGQVVAVAGDARWVDHDRQANDNGRPEYHALMRVISMVANKELRRRLAAGRHNKFADTCSEGRPGQPLHNIESYYLQSLEDDQIPSTYRQGPPVQTEIRGEGYLCSGLDLYLTHEPCVCCAMAMVHSRFRTCTFVDRMPKTGALCARINPTALGYGLFWRRELNWRVMTFQYKSTCNGRKAAVSAEVFQA